MLSHRSAIPVDILCGLLSQARTFVTVAVTGESTPPELGASVNAGEDSITVNGWRLIATSPHAATTTCPPGVAEGGTVRLAEAEPEPTGADSRVVALSHLKCTPAEHDPSSVTVAVKESPGAPWSVESVSVGATSGEDSVEGDLSVSVGGAVLSDAEAGMLVELGDVVGEGVVVVLSARAGPPANAATMRAHADPNAAAMDRHR